MNLISTSKNDKLLCVGIIGEAMKKRNYSKELEEIISRNKSDGIKPTLLLHACCAPCSSYVLEYLTPHFEITLLFYNPNISTYGEYKKRSDELARLVREMPVEIKELIIEPYEPKEFLSVISGFENAPEGGERCGRCYDLRLRKAADKAKELGCDYFTTTLSISPHKSAEKLNVIGERLAAETGIKQLPSDFKKKEGYKRSTELSKEYNLYRQSFCGCSFSEVSE